MNDLTKLQRYALALIVLGLVGNLLGIAFVYGPERQPETIERALDKCPEGTVVVTVRRGVIQDVRCEDNVEGNGLAAHEPK